MTIRSWLPLSGVAAAVLAAAGLYYALLSPVASPPAPQHASDASQLSGRVERLASRMRDSPRDAAGWGTLARSYAALGRFEDSAAAFEHAAGLAPGDAQLLADYADVAAVTQRNKFKGKPAALIARALAADPMNPKALWLSAAAEFESGDYAAAAGQWRRMLSVVPADSAVARSARRAIAEAERRVARN